MDETINERQRRIVDFIQAEISAKGYPPSIREIGKAVGLQSTAAVANQLRALEGKRVIRRDPSKPRAIEIIGRNRGDGLNEGNPLPFPCFDSVDSFAGCLKAEKKPHGENAKMCLRGTALVRVNGDGLPGLAAARFGAREGDYLLVAEPCDLNPMDAVIFRANGSAPRFGIVSEAGKKQVVVKSRKSLTVPRGDILGKVSAVIRRFK